MKNFFQGYKTYVVAALTAVVVFLHSIGYIDDETYKTLIGLLGAGALGTVAAKINRMKDAIPK